jgi:hypothetical protein
LSCVIPPSRLAMVMVLHLCLLGSLMCLLKFFELQSTNWSHPADSEWWWWCCIPSQPALWCPALFPFFTFQGSWHLSCCYNAPPWVLSACIQEPHRQQKLCTEPQSQWPPCALKTASGGIAAFMFLSLKPKMNERQMQVLTVAL